MTTQFQEETTTQESSLGTRFKAAGMYAAKQAQRKTLASTTLASAYRALGEHVYRRGQYRDELSEVSQQIDKLLAARNALESQAASRPKAEGIAAKTAAAAIGAKEMAQKKSLEVQVGHAFARLGEAAFQLHGEGCGPSEVVQPVVQCQKQLAALDEEIGRLSHTAQSGTPLTEHTGIIVALLIVFFPVGLYFVWKHPVWSQQRKMAWTGVCVLVLVVGGIGVAAERKGAQKTLVEGNRLWDSGKKADAADKYRSLVEGSGLEYIDKADQAMVFRRAIEFDAEGGNTDQAKKMIGKAGTLGIPLSLESPKAVALLNEAKAGRTASESVQASKEPAAGRPLVGARADAEANVPFSPGSSTKAQFIQKMQEVMYAGQINDMIVNANFVNGSFHKTFGDPDTNVRSGQYDRLYRYRCLDGALVLTVTIAGDTVILKGMDQY